MLTFVLKNAGGAVREISELLIERYPADRKIKR
jgi:hypothetical protein